MWTSKKLSLASIVNQGVGRAKLGVVLGATTTASRTRNLFVSRAAQGDIGRVKRLNGMDAMLLYSETPSPHTHTLKIATVDTTDPCTADLHQPHSLSSKDFRYRDPVTGPGQTDG